MGGREWRIEIGGRYGARRQEIVRERGIRENGDSGRTDSERELGRERER